jgi:urease accessory protein
MKTMAMHRVEMDIAATPTSEIFAANRAASSIVLDVQAARGATRCARLFEHGALRMRFPNSPPERLEAVLVNTGGGIAGGDRLSLALSVSEDAQLAVTSAAAEKVYRSLGPDADIDMRLSLAADASLAWLPQETILFDRACLRRSIAIDMHRDARLVFAESLVLGRTAMGETMREGKLFDRWRLRRGGSLLFAETTRLEGDVAEKLARKAVAAGGHAFATVLIVPGEAAVVAKAREVSVDRGCEAGASAWNGLALVRLLAGDAAALRQALGALLIALAVPLPRLWLN